MRLWTAHVSRSDSPCLYAHKFNSQQKVVRSVHTWAEIFLMGCVAGGQFGGKKFEVQGQGHLMPGNTI